MSKLILAFCMISFFGTAFANESNDDVWSKYNRSMTQGNCANALEALDALMELEPIQANGLKGVLYAKGQCLPKDEDKALEHFKAYPKEELFSFHALMYSHILFKQAETPEQKQAALKGIREIFLDMSSLFNTADLLEQYLSNEYPNSPKFIYALQDEINFFRKIDNDKEFKLLQAEKLLEQEKFPDLSSMWLHELIQAEVPRAYYVFATKTDLGSGMIGHLKFAANNDIVEAMIALAQSYEKYEDSFGYRKSYFWYLAAKRNGMSVDEQILKIKKNLTPEDIAYVEGEALNKDSVLR